MSDRPKVLNHPYGTYLMVRPEFVLLRDDDIEARLMRIIEGWMEHQKAAWQAEYMAAVNAKQPPPPEPEEYWVTISQSQFIAQLYMFDTANLLRTIPRDEDGRKIGPVSYEKQNYISKGTLRTHLNALKADKMIFIRPQPGHEFESAQYTLNRPLVQALMDKLPKNYLSLFGGGVTMIECPPVTTTVTPTYNECNSPVTTGVTPQLQPLYPLIDYRIDSEKTTQDESTYTQVANALAQSTHETANGESDAPTPTLPGHLSGDASDSSEHHVLPVIPGIPGDHRSASLSVDSQIVNGGDNGSDNNNLRDDHNASRHDNRVLDVPRRLEAPPSCEVSEQTPTFSVPSTDEVPLLTLPPNTPSTPGRVEHKATPASGAKPQRKPKVATGKTSTIGQSRISAIIDCMDATIQQLTGDPQFCFSRSKKAQDIIWDTLIKDRKEGQGVTPTMLRATITRMYNTPKDPRSGFDWKENMSIASICNNFDKFSIGLAAKQPPKVAPVELDAEALEEERRRLEFAIKHAERWAKPAPMAPAPHAVVPIVAKGSGR